MTNPEFKRNLWLQFSLHRLIAMPAVLGLTFFAVASAGSATALFNALSPAVIVLVWLWGTRAAAASVTDEIRDKTWDQQRMSALQPWAMTWGKLFGATSFCWYGGVLCLLLSVAIAATQGNLAAAIQHALILVAVGILMHASSIALNLHSSRMEASLIQRGGIGWIVILLALFLFPWTYSSQEGPVLWWHREWPRDTFVLWSSVLFAACAVFAAWRVMSNALQVRTTPWAWPLFACLFAAYLAGLGEHASLHQFFRIGVLVSAGMTYAALFSEPNGIPVWQRVLLRLKKRDWRGLLEHLPAWTSTLLLTFLFAAVATVQQAGVEQPGYSQDARSLDILLPAIAFAALRDCCILLVFAFSGNARRVEGTTLLYLIVINGLLPFLAGVTGMMALRYFLLPVEPPDLLWSTAIMALHAAIALALVIWRWREQQARAR